MVCTVPHAWHIPCLQIRSKSIHSMRRKQKSLPKHSALELQNIFLEECCKSTSSLQVITTSGCSNSRLWSFPSYHQGLFRWQWSAQSVLRQYLPCSPRAAMSEAGRYLNSRSCTILRATTLCLTLHCCTKTIHNSWGFFQSTGACLLLFQG